MDDSLEIQSPPRWLSIPAEIRNKIYAQLFSDATIFIRYPGPLKECTHVGEDGTVERERIDTSRLLIIQEMRRAVMLTCRQVRREARAAFFKSATWNLDMETFDAIVRNTHRLPSFLRCRIPSIGFLLVKGDIGHYLRATSRINPSLTDQLQEKLPQLQQFSVDLSVALPKDYFINDADLHNGNLFTVTQRHSAFKKLTEYLENKNIKLHVRLSELSDNALPSDTDD